MLRTEYDRLTKVRAIPPTILKGSDLKDQTPRTLLYGYTCDRETFHVYLDEDGKIYRVVYNFNRTLLYEGNEDTLTDNSYYVPNKRLYPERCDFEFCTLLAEQGVPLPFTTWDDRPLREVKFFGEILADLKA